MDKYSIKQIAPLGIKLVGETAKGRVHLLALAIVADADGNDVLRYVVCNYTGEPELLPTDAFVQLTHQ